MNISNGNSVSSTSQILDGIIVNADINASAAIAYSKLALTGGIVDADVSASAAIAITKLAAGTQGDILYAGASGVWTKLPAGTSGQALISGGAAANPSWGAVGGFGSTTDVSGNFDSAGHQAATDVKNYGNFFGSGSANHQALIYVDAASTPTTEVIRCENRSANYPQYSPFSFCVKKGQYYKVVLNNSMTVTHAYSIALGS